MEHKCPHCGGDIASEIEAAFASQRSKAGSTRTQKKTTSSSGNMAKARAAANSPERLEAKRESMARARAARQAKLEQKKSRGE